MQIIVETLDKWRAVEAKFCMRGIRATARQAGEFELTQGRAKAAGSRQQAPH